MSEIWTPNITPNLTFSLFRSRTISPRRFSCKTTIRRLMSGRWASCSTLCSRARCRFREIQSSKLSAMLSKVIFISIMSHSHDTALKPKNSSNVSSKRTFNCVIQRSRHSTILGSRIISNCPKSLSIWRVKASGIPLRRSHCEKQCFRTFARR